MYDTTLSKVRNDYTKSDGRILRERIQAQNGHDSTQRKVRSRIGAFLNDEKFMENFDPERSARETRKMNRKINAQSRNNSVYDDKGVHVESGKDLCDCLSWECEGCYFPCPKCKSEKCGNECRVNRKWIYRNYDIDGTDVEVKNPLLTEMGC